jgi:putative two-component system response regulator
MNGEQSVYNLVDFNKEERICEQNRIFQIDLVSMISEGFAELVEYNDDHTGNHVKRVGVITEILARALKDLPKYRDQLSEEFISLLRLSSPLHDIGKVSVPEAILLKPGPLTEDEFKLMQKHSEVGGHILKNLHAKISYYGIDYFEIAASIAKYHHEWYDGSGYPEGLLGDDIPLEAQITAVVDVLDALISKRPYKSALSIEVALKVILEGKGSHFNPDIVDVLVTQIENIKKIYRLLGDEDE